MKIIKWILIILFILVVLIVIGVAIINVKVDEDSLPIDVYEEDANLMTLVDEKLYELFIATVTDDYTLVEEIINLIILDSIKENVNNEYDPLSDCEDISCNFIVHKDFYYLDFIWAELNDDDQLIIHVSVGSDKIIPVNTIFHFYFDINIDYTGFGIELELDKYLVDDNELSMGILDYIFNQIDRNQIESEVTTGELDLEDYSYTISFSIGLFP